MKIKLKKLLPNPFRDIGNYPIDKTRVEKLKGSIESTEFWGGLVCREHPTKEGYFQLAFGHHRKQALKELKYKEVSIKVSSYTDAQMLQAMAEENRDVGQHDIKIMTNTVEQVKLYLDDELAKCESWSTSNKFIRGLFKNQKSFDTTKGMGAGQTTILKFLGNTWKQSEIQFALKVLDKEKQKTVNRKAIEKFPNRYQAEEFEEAIDDQDIPIEDQEEVAEKTKKKLKEKKRGGRAIKSTVKEVMREKKKKKPENPDVVEAREIIKDIETYSNRLRKKIATLKKLMRKIEPDKLKTLNTIIAGMALNKLVEQIEIISKENKNENEKPRRQISGKTT